MLETVRCSEAARLTDLWQINKDEEVRTKPQVPLKWTMVNLLHKGTLSASGCSVSSPVLT